MAAAPQAQLATQPNVASGSGIGTGPGLGGEPGYRHHQLPFHNAQPPLYHYSTPHPQPLYQNNQGYSIPSTSSPASSSATGNFAPASVFQSQFQPGPSPQLGLPQHPYHQHPSLPASMTSVATSYQPPLFELGGAQKQKTGMKSDALGFEEGWEDVGAGTGKANHERFYSGGRQRTPVEAARIFEHQYQICSKPSKEVRADLSQRSGLPLRTVQIWFQNRRAKDVLEAKRAVMAQAAAASAAAVAAGLPPPPAPAFPPSRRQVMRVSSNSGNGNMSDMNRTPSGPKSNHQSGSGSASTSSVSTTPDVAFAPLPESTSSETGPASAPPVMAPNDHIMYPQLINPNPAFYGYAYPSVGAAVVGGSLGSPARMGRRSSIANGEAANIATIVQRQQRGSIGAANAARRGSIPYPPSIHSALLSANVNANGTGSSPSSPHQNHRNNAGHNVAGGGLMSSPLSPRGSASQLAKTALRNNSRRASMPVNGGLFALTQSTVVTSPTPTPVRAQPFTPPRTVSGTVPAPLPSDGRVTRELPPSTDHVDQVQAKAALLPQMPGSGSMNGASPSGFDPAIHTPTRSSSGTANGSALFTIPSHGSTDSFIQPLTSFDGLQHSASTDTVGPLPNPTFVFGNAQPQAPGQQGNGGMINYGIDETYLSMQDRSRLNSLASIGTYASEVPTEMSSEFGGNGGFDYLPVPEGFDMYSRRASAPADLIDGMGMVVLNPMGTNPSNQPIRPSPLGQTHSVSSDHLRTQAAQRLGYGYNMGLGLPINPNTNGLALSQSQHSGSTSPADYPQPTQQWNPALTFAPLVSRETSNSTDNIYTPSSFFPPSTTGNADGNGNAAVTGLDLSSFDAQDWANLGIGINLPPQPQSVGAGAGRGYTLPHLNSSEFIASLNYADQVVPEEDEEDKEHINLAFQPDQMDHLVLQP